MYIAVVLMMIAVDEIIVVVHQIVVVSMVIATSRAVRRIVDAVLIAVRLTMDLDLRYRQVVQSGRDLKFIIGFK